MKILSITLVGLILTVLPRAAAVQAEDSGLILMYSDLEPYVIVEDNIVSGFLADYLNNVTKDAKIKAIWENVPWERQIPTLKRNQPNVCAVGLVETPERLAYMRFTDFIGIDEAFILMAVKNHQGLLNHKSFHAVLDDQTLKPILKGQAVFSPYINGLLANREFETTTSSTPRRVRSLTKNKNTYIIITPYMAENMLAKNDPKKELGIYRHFDDLGDDVPYSLACSKSTDDDLFNRLNAQIKIHGISYPK